MKNFITTTFARAGGWLAGARRVRAAMMLLLLTVFLMPQTATAADSRSDYESNYVGRDWYWGNSWNTVYVTVTYWNDYGTDEGWCDENGLTIRASKDGGTNYEEIGHIKTSSSGGLTLTGSLYQESSGGGTYDKWVRVKWTIPRQWRNCNIKITCGGHWKDSDNKTDHGWKSTDWSFTSSYTHTVRDHYWNGEPTVSADGTVTVPYKFGTTAGNTDGETLLFPQINGRWNGTIGFRNPPSNYSAGSYTFKLTDLGADMRTEFTITPIHEFIHHNDKDASNGRKDYWKSAGAKTILPKPLATITSAVFTQKDRKVVLNWTADNTNYGNGKWVIYRNDTKIGTVSQGTYTYTDQNPTDNAGTTFPYESNVKYFIYYVADGWAETTQRSELKSNEVTVNTTRKVPVNNPSAVSQADRIVFTWTSDGYPANWGNQFKIYIDNVLAYTLTPSANQTSFQWEHRTTDQHTDRQNKTDNGIPYTEEPLNACTPHTYRIDGVIGGKVFTTKPFDSHAIGNATLFYSFDATKGVYPGMVKLSWHVDRQGSNTAKTYIVERRRAEKDNEPWVTLYRTSSTEDYLMYTDDTPLPGVFYEYQVTVEDRCASGGDPIKKQITDIGFRPRAP